VAKQRDTLRPEQLEQERSDALREQRELSFELMTDPNPHVRVIAHMAQRQLDMFELLLKIRDDVEEIKQKQKFTVISSRPPLEG
jgi:hypothetical protein